MIASAQVMAGLISVNVEAMTNVPAILRAVQQPYLTDDQPTGLNN